MNKNITSAPTTDVDRYSSEIYEILSILGFTESYVTDESIIGDFLLNPKMFEDELERANEEAHNAVLLEKISLLCGGCEILETTRMVEAAKNIWHFEGEIR